jgi:hypothetical protein
MHPPMHKFYSSKVHIFNQFFLRKLCNCHEAAKKVTLKMKIKLIQSDIILFLCTLILLMSSCQNEDIGIDSVFLEKETQESTERVVISELILSDNLPLMDLYGITSASTLKLDDSYIYINNPFEKHVHIIKKHSYDYIGKIAPGEGRGPGEVTGLGYFDVTDDYIIVAAESQHKIQLWDKEGNLAKEFISDEIRPHRVTGWPDGSITILSTFLTDADLVFHTVDKDGEILQQFGAIDTEYFNPLMYSGSTVQDDNYFYYAGFSEHVLVKWDREGNHLYSKSTIDDFPGELNYNTFLSGEEKVFRYSDTGLFSAVGSAIYGDFWILIHAGERGSDTSTRLLDIYFKQDGSYAGSFMLPYRAGFGTIAVDESYIYTLHNIDDETHIGIYENNLKELVEEAGIARID